MVKAIIQILFYNSIDKDNNTKNNDILLSA